MVEVSQHIAKPSPSVSWFKILNAEGKPIDGSNERWSLPKGSMQGSPLDTSLQPLRFPVDERWEHLPGYIGTWLVANPAKLLPPGSGYEIYVAEVLGEVTFQTNDMIWVTRCRLVRLATFKTLRSYGIHLVRKPHIY